MALWINRQGEYPLASVAVLVRYSHEVSRCPLSCGTMQISLFLLVGCRLSIGVHGDHWLLLLPVG